MADWLGVGEGLGVADLLVEALADALALLLAGVALAEPVGVPVGVDVPVGLSVPVRVGEPPGANDVGVPEGVPPVQAETDADASTAAHPIAINLPLSRVPAMTERIFIGLRVPRQVPDPFPVLASETVPGTEIACLARVPAGLGRSQKAP